MAQWVAAAHRGQLDLDVLTKRRAIAEGYVLRPDVEFLGVIYPDGGDALLIGFLSLERASGWIREMAPRDLRVLAAHDENASALREAIGDLALSGKTVQ